MTKYAARDLVLSLEGDEVAQVTDMGEFGSARGLIDASAYGDDWKDFVVDQQEGEEVDVVLAYDPADNSHQAVVAAYEAGEPVNWEVAQASSGFDVVFPAIMTKLTRGGARDGLTQMSTSIKILNPGVQDAS